MSKAIDIACAVAADIARLPGVATLDWCDRAAGALATIFTPGGASVTVLTRGDDGVRVVGASFSGVAFRPESRATHAERESIRASLSRVATIDPRLVGRASALSRLAPPASHASQLGDLCRDAGAEDLVTGVAAPPNSPLALLACAWPLEGPRAITGDDERLLEAALPLLAGKAVAALGNAPLESTTWITEKEQEVLDRLVIGRTVREIADEIGRSPHTVHDHVKSLHRKLGASSRGELIARALGRST